MATEKRRLALQKLLQSRDASSSNSDSKSSPTPRPTRLEPTAHEQLKHVIRTIDEEALRDALIALIREDVLVEKAIYHELIESKKGPIWERCTRCKEEFDAATELVWGACKHHSFMAFITNPHERTDAYDKKGELFSGDARPEIWTCSFCRKTLDTPPCQSGSHQLPSRKRKLSTSSESSESD